MLPIIGYLAFVGLSSFSLVSADDGSFLAFPKDRTNSKQTNDTDTAIKQLIGAGKVYSYVSQYYGVAFWLAPMSTDQQKKIQALPGVDSLAVNNITTADDTAIPAILPSSESEGSSSRLQKREGTIDYRQNPVDDLKLVSWPNGKNWRDLNTYAFDEAAGTDTWTYLIENGVNNQNPEITGNAPETPYFYGPDAQATDTDDDVKGHGTCMASKAGGARLGVASKTHLMVVKASGTKADNIWAFERIRDDVIFNDRHGKAVVLFARGPTVTWPGLENLAPWPRIKSVMQDMFTKDIVIVTSSGNRGELPLHRNVDSPPEMWSADNFPLIVVGAVDNQGKVAYRPGKTTSFSQGGPLVTVWAPGVDVTCAAHDTQGTRLDLGTSPASAMTAGLVSYFLSFRTNRPFPVGSGNTASEARKYLLAEGSASWKRPGNQDQRAIWNGVDSLANNNAGAVSTPVSTPAPVSTPEAPQAPYAQGTCSIHVTQWKSVFGETGDYDLEVLMTDNDKNQIGYGERWGPYSSTNPLQFMSHLEDLLTCMPEEHNDYIAFALGPQQWPSSATGSIPSCSVGGWDANIGEGNQANRQMDCSFICTWGGGKSSDGTGG